MNKTKIYPRPEQLFLLTEGINKLPLEPIQYTHKLIIIEMIAHAWEEVIKFHSGSKIQLMDEPEITTSMTTCLNRLIMSHPIWGMLFSSVSRGSEQFNFDASHLEKQPDIQIIFNRQSPYKGLSANFPFIIECKIIEASKTVNLYCKYGLSRFLNGEYAWYAREAMMLAYVKDKSTLTSTLIPQLEKYQKKTPDTYATCKLPTKCHFRNKHHE